MIAPCGHPGEVVIGHYVQCMICDAGAVPERVDPEKTQPMPGFSRHPYWSNDPKTCRHGGGKYAWAGKWICTPCGTVLGVAP